MIFGYDIDLVIFIGFMVANLAIGLLYSSGIKSIREYAVGTKTFSTGTLTATIIATCVGGGNVVVSIAESYRQGLYFIIPSLGEPLALIITGYFLAPRMAEFLNNLSIAEAMGDLYGKHVRLITAIGSIVLCIGIVGAEFKISATVLKLFFNVNSFYAVLASAVIVILYSTFGGIKAVTFTDVIQFFTFGTIVPLVSLAIWGSVGDPTKVFDLINTNPMFSLSEVFDISNPKMLNASLLLLFFLVPALQPVFFQRVIMAKNTVQAKNAFVIAGVTVIALLLIISWIGVLLLADNPSLDPNGLLTYILGNYSYTGLKGLTAIGIMAVIMSTTDSYINSAAVILSHDILTPADHKTSWSPTGVALPRICAAFIGVSAFFLAFNVASILELIIQVLSFYMPIVSPALILAIFGFRSTTKSVLIGMAAGFLTVLAFIFVDFGVDGVMPGVAANVLFFMGSHYLLRQPGGWVGIKDESPLVELRMMRKAKWRRRIEAFKNFNFMRFCQNNAPKEDRTYTFFGLFSLISVFSTMYSIPAEIQQDNASLFKFIYDTVLLSSTVFLTYPAWPPTVKQEKFIVLFWTFVAPYILVSAPIILVIASGFGQFQLMILMLNMIVLSMLLRWQVAVVMIALYCFIGAEYYKWFTGESIGEVLGISLQFKMMYILLMFSSVLIGFLKPQQEHEEFLGEKIDYMDHKLTDQKDELTKAHMAKNEFLRNMEHEAHTPITGITSMGQVLYESYDKFSSAQIKDGLKDIAQSSERLRSLVDNLIDLSKLSCMTVCVEKTKINLSVLLLSRLEICQKIYTKDKPLEFDVTKIDPKVILDADEYYMRSLFDNLIANAMQYTKQGKIELTLRYVKKPNSSKNVIEFTIKDEGIGIPITELYDIFNPFTTSSKTRSNAGGRGIGLALAKKIVEAHNGKIWAESDGTKGSVFKFTIDAVT